MEYARKSGGMGIHNMEQRAQRLGGRLEIISSPGAGTRIKAEIPLRDMRWSRLRKPQELCNERNHPCHGRG